MQDWRQHLNGDPLPWLLEAENASVRYWTLVDILDRPAHDPEVREARAAIAHQSLVKELFARQRPEGYWGDDETKPYTASVTPKQVSGVSTRSVMRRTHWWRS